jgi:hypothetical protein
MASISLPPWLPWVSTLPAEQETLDNLDLLANGLQLFRTLGSSGSLYYLLSRRLLTTWTSWRMASSSFAPWLPWVSILPAEQETLDHLDLLANGLQLFSTLALLCLYLTC